MNVKNASNVVCQRNQLLFEEYVSQGYCFRRLFLFWADRITGIWENVKWPENRMCMICLNGVEQIEEIIMVFGFHMCDRVAGS